MLKENVYVIEQDVELPGYLTLPKNPVGFVIFALGSGKGRLETKNAELAQRLFEEGIGTLLVDLLTEEEGESKEMVYNVKLLSKRLEAAMDWASKHKLLKHLPLGLFGSQTGSAAAMSAAAHSKHAVAALVSRGGRIDMADKYLPYVEAPCLLIAAGRDELTLKANKNMMERLSYVRLHVIDAADHLFQDERVTDEVASVAARWFKRYFNRSSYQAHSEEYRPENMRLPFYDRFEASHFLARKLMRFKDEDPLILAIPRGAVPMADIISTELDWDMDVVLVKKIGAPGNPEVAIGSVNEFGDVYLSSSAKAYADEEEIAQEATKSQNKLKEYRRKLGALREPKGYQGRAVIIVDDGIATGSTMLSAVITAKEKGARKVIVAAPVASKAAEKMLALASDETVFLDVPENFYAVAQFYENFPQVGDGEVEQILR